MNEVTKRTAPDINKDVDTILNIILNGRTEQEAVYLAHIITKEVDRFFDHLEETQDVRIN